MACSIIQNSRNFASYLFFNSLCNFQKCTSPFTRQKHWNQKFRKERKEKVLKVFLPDFQEDRNNEKLSVEEMRAKIKEKGILPYRQWNEKPLFISCTSDVFEPYVPPEGDGKISITDPAGIKQMYQTFGKKSKSYLALRKIRNIDFEFDVPTVAGKALEVYIEALNLLVNKDEEKLHDFVTEKAYPEMFENVKNKTLKWNFIETLEPPRIVQVRIQDMMSKDNTFAQVTVRLHTRQTLAIYDRFGHLMHGSTDTVKDVLEYLVFEKHISHLYGTWRIHGKIIPDWLPPRDVINKTYIYPDIDKEHPEPPTNTLKEEPSKESSRELTEGTLLPAS